MCRAVIFVGLFVALLSGRSSAQVPIGPPPPGLQNQLSALANAAGPALTYDTTTGTLNGHVVKSGDWSNNEVGRKLRGAANPNGELWLNEALWIDKSYLIGSEAFFALSISLGDLTTLLHELNHHEYLEDFAIWLAPPNGNGIKLDCDKGGRCAHAVVHQGTADDLCKIASCTEGLSPEELEKLKERAKKAAKACRRSAKRCKCDIFPSPLMVPSCKPEGWDGTCPENC